MGLTLLCGYCFCFPNQITLMYCSKHQVFQRRIDGISDFYRSWDDYKHGFGTVSRENDFWLGNEQLFYLTNQKAYKLRVDITTSAGSPLYSEYSAFTISGKGLMYRLHVSALTAGNAGM